MHTPLILRFLSAVIAYEGIMVMLAIFIAQAPIMLIIPSGMLIIAKDLFLNRRWSLNAAMFAGFFFMVLHPSLTSLLVLVGIRYARKNYDDL